MWLLEPFILRLPWALPGPTPGDNGEDTQSWVRGVGLGGQYKGAYGGCHCEGKRVNLVIMGYGRSRRLDQISNKTILAYDITDKDSFQKVKCLVKELQKVLGNEICVCIVGRSYNRLGKGETCFYLGSRIICRICGNKTLSCISQTE